jgi:hypothetical protein
VNIYVNLATTNVICEGDNCSELWKILSQLVYKWSLYNCHSLPQTTKVVWSLTLTVAWRHSYWISEMYSFICNTPAGCHKRNASGSSTKKYLNSAFVKRPTNAQGSSGLFINTFQILPRHVSAYCCHHQGVVSAL